MKENWLPHYFHYFSLNFARYVPVSLPTIHSVIPLKASHTFILELKNTKALSLPQFWREAVVEAQNYAGARGITPAPLSYVVVKRRSAGIEQAWVVQDLEQWLEEKNG